MGDPFRSANCGSLAGTLSPNVAAVRIYPPTLKLDPSYRP
jgi:hypothetical protein